MTQTKERIIFEKEYHGFDEFYDLDRDIHEAFDERYNPNMVGLPGEFKGIMRVTVTYKNPSEE